MNDFWKLENEYYNEGFSLICGVDEAGRGPLAGRVYAAAVCLPRNEIIPGLDDSKKLSETKRDILYDIILERAICSCVAFATVEEIEENNILNATYMAMNRAISGLDPMPDVALVDGNRNSGIELYSRCVVKGDSLCANISAASILAKISRDRYMCEMAAIYPQYGFDKHKGYGTAAHYKAIKRFGPCELHRLSFLRKMH